MLSESVTVYLGLGSNMGDREDNMNMALDYLSQRLQMGQVSPIYETEPIGDVEQPRFLNCVCQVFTRLAPSVLLALIKGIEVKLGRTLGKSNAPRPIDIDILYMEGVSLSTAELTIPHRELFNRYFVLVPLSELVDTLNINGKKMLLKKCIDAVQNKDGQTLKNAVSLYKSRSSYSIDGPN